MDRFKKRWIAAEQARDKEALDRLNIFYKNLGSFGRLYDFLSQIVSYADSDLETSYLFFRDLEPLVRPDRIRQQIELSDLVLTHHKIRSDGTIAIPLGTEVAEEKLLYPITAVGTQAAHDPEKVRLAELVQQLNDLFDDGSLTEADKVGMFQHVAGKMMENAEINRQARGNTKEQFTHSPTIGSVLVDALVAAIDSYQAMGKKVFQDKAAMDRFQSMLVDYVYERVNASSDAEAPAAEN